MKSWLNKLQAILLPLVLLIVFIVVMSTIIAPIKETFEYFPDEGNNLMKSLLFLKGFSLYKEIWSDQPPLFTVVLSYWLKLFGLSVYSGRILILIFSFILLWAFYQIIKDQWGGLCASIAVIFLLLSVLYLPMSVSILIDLPALALAMLSIYCATLYRKYYLKQFLILSGIFMALSLQTKPITAFLIPLIVLEIIRAKGLSVKGKKHSIFPLILWLSSFLTIYLAIIIIFFHFNFHILVQQLIKPHSTAGAIPEYTVRTLFFMCRRMLFKDWDILLLGLTGTILLIRQKKRQLFLPVLWLILILVLLLKHRPVWNLYYFYIATPLSWLAAIGFSEFIANIRRNKRFLKMFDIFLYRLTGAIVILTIVMLPIKYHRICKSLWDETSPEKHKAVETLLKYRSHTHWIFTDRPIFAFYANILTPPELTMVSEKRRLSGNMPDDYIIYVLKNYRPEQILLARFQDYSPELLSYIERNYTKIYHSRFLISTALTRDHSTKYLIRWKRKRMKFAHRVWFFKFPVLRVIELNHYQQLASNYTKEVASELKIYLRKDINILQ